MKASQRIPIRYVVGHRATGAKHNYNDVIGTATYYSFDGRQSGVQNVEVRKEPGLESPLLDPIDFAGSFGSLVKAGVKGLSGPGVKRSASSVAKKVDNYDPVKFRQSGAVGTAAGKTVDNYDPVKAVRERKSVV